MGSLKLEKVWILAMFSHAVSHAFTTSTETAQSLHPIERTSVNSVGPLSLEF